MQVQSGAMLIVLNPEWLCDAVLLWQCVSDVSHIKNGGPDEAVRRLRACSEPYLALNTTLVLIAVSFGMILMSAQSPLPIPKSSRLTVALPFRTGCVLGVQVKVSVTGLVMPCSSNVPSAAYLS